MASQFDNDNEPVDLTAAEREEEDRLAETLTDAEILARVLQELGNPSDYHDPN